MTSKIESMCMLFLLPFFLVKYDLRDYNLCVNTTLTLFYFLFDPFRKEKREED